MRFWLLLGLAGLSAATDFLLSDPDITSTVVTGRDGNAHTLIPMVLPDLTALASTTTAHTTITDAENGELATPTVDIIVQPHGIWWRDGLLGPPVPPPISEGSGPQTTTTNGALLPPPQATTGTPPPPATTLLPPPPVTTDAPPPPATTPLPPPQATTGAPPPPATTDAPPPPATTHAPPPPATTDGPSPRVTTDPACTDRKPVPSCAQTCSIVIQTSGVTTSSCATPTCTSILACSATATTSTVFEEPTPIIVCSAGQPSSPLPPVSGPTSCPLAKRTVLEPQHFEGSNINKFVNFELREGEAKGNLLESDEADVRGPPTSKRLTFGNQAFRSGTTGLRGCTVVFVISKQGMWSAHFWEIPSIGIALVHNNQILGVIDSDPQIFQRDVIDFINNGDGAQNPGLAQDTGNGRIFAAADALGIIIVTPRRSENAPAGVLRYPQRMSRIQQEITRLIPGIGATIIDYVPMDDDDQRKQPKHGTVLVQYDPRQPVAGTTQRKPIVRVYVEGTQLPDIRWDTLPQQVKVRRDIGDTPDTGCGELLSPPPSPTPTTLVTSTISAEPTTNQSPPASEPPISTPPVSTPSVPGKYTIHLHQQMERETSKLEWTLLDSNGKEILPLSANAIIPGDVQRNEVKIDVSSPTNKDNTDITFTLHADAGDGCNPQWDTGTTGNGDKPFVTPCKNGKREDYHCDDVHKVNWKPLGAGFERELNCFWQDIGKPSTIEIRSFS